MNRNSLAIIFCVAFCNVITCLAQEISQGPFALISSSAGNALNFDGLIDRAVIPDNPLLSGGSGKSITVEAWVKPTAVADHHQVIAKFLDKNWKDWGIEIEFGKLVVDIENNGDNWLYIDGSVSRNVWTHIAFTFDNRKDTVRIYVNGVAAGPGKRLTKNMPDTDAAILLGNHSYAEAHAMPGIVDEVRIWNFARTGAELRSDMNRLLNGDEQGLIGYWRLDEGSGQTSADLTQNGNAVRLGATNSGEASDPAWVVSDAPVSVEEFAQVTSPNGGEQWTAGSNHSITWSASTPPLNVRLEFSTDAGAHWDAIVESTANDGSYLWLVPDSISTDCLIRLSDADDNDPTDVSDAVFSIAAPPSPTITLTSPNGNESLVIGNSYNVTWSSTGTLGNVRLEYSVNNGTDWAVIVGSTSNDGKYLWTIPDEVSNEGLVRISDAADGDPQDMSDAVFSIVVPPPLPIVDSFSPPSGQVGTEVTITGNNFVSVVGVKVNSTSVSSFITDSATQLRLTVPSGATTGKISVTTTAGTALSENDFVVISNGGETLSFQPSDDAYVKLASPASNFGSVSALRQRQSGSEKLYSFLKFNISGVSGAVQNAVLRFYVTDASNDGGTVYVVSNNYLNTTTPWLQSGLNWSNAPVISGTALSSVGAVSVGATVEFDVTAAIVGDGVYSFGLKNNSNDPVYYSSQESSNKPLLIIQTGTASPSAPSIASFAPSSGPVGTEVTIAGNNFTGATIVKFNGTVATEFNVDSNTEIRATVPNGATTGKISVITPNGTAVSANNFTISSSGGNTTLSFLPSDDAYVKLSSPASNFGSASTLRLRKTNSETITIYLKFEIAGLDGAVQNAKLRLYVTDAGNDGGAVYLVSNNYLNTATPWLQSGLNWNNSPEISGTPLSNAGTVSVGSWVEFDVTTAISGNGVYSFGLKNNSSDVVYYTSTEGSNKPELVIQGDFTTLASVAAQESSEELTLLPESFTLYQNYPNPFNPETLIEFDLPQALTVRLIIYNVLGREVARLVDEERSTGRNSLVWDGRDENGVKVSSGIYFYSLQAGEFRASKKMLLVQ